MERNNPTPAPQAAARSRQRRRRIGGWLLLFVAIGSLATFPYSLSIMRQVGWASEPSGNATALLGEHVATDIFLSLGAVAFGLRLGKSVGLGLPLVVGWPPVDSSTRRQVRNTLVLAAGLGIAIGVLDAAAEWAVGRWLPPPRFPITAPPAWTDLLASLGAGVTEEILFRLGLMTFLVWLAARDTSQFLPSAWAIWTGNAIAALLFGGAHLPQAALVYGLTGPIVIFTLLGNAIPGLVFGWLYWKRGLVAAMVCHGVADVVLKSILPLLGLA